MNWYETFLLWGGFYSASAGWSAGLGFGLVAARPWFLCGLLLVVLYIMGKAMRHRQIRIAGVESNAMY